MQHSFFSSLVLGVFLCTASITSTAQHIGLYASDFLMEESVSALTIADTKVLLEQACQCTVSINPKESDIAIILPEITDKHKTKAHHTDHRRPYPYFQYPDHSYTWNMRSDGDRRVLELQAASLAGVSCGLYGLLQEQLGFAFYHPREMMVPDLRVWPALHTTWSASPRFSKKGFHLHTQHPLELTEQLMMLDDESWKDVKEYIDWLARNQQNYFEYNLLEGIDRNTWPLLARRMVDYLHARGIIAGIDLSLHMTQQKSFMLYENPPTKWTSKRRQIKRNTDLLFTAPWDIWNVEFSTTEFTGGNIEKKKALQQFLNRELMNRGAKLMGRAHVVKEDAMIGGEDGEQTLYGSATEEQVDDLDQHRGIMSHTVMFYTASEPVAPVYGNENLRHMLTLLKEEQKVRETWYYPESAYWITFDSSVPMFLMPYLRARLEDILLMDSLNVEGHLTFSSGWEWGYWLIDWSIARWSWEQRIEGVVQPTKPTQFLKDVLQDTRQQEFFSRAEELQQHHLKDRGLIRYIVAQTVTDEMPPPLDLPLHPRPDWKYKWLMNNADTATLSAVKEEVLPALEAYHADYRKLRDHYFKKGQEFADPIVRELMIGLDITSLRSLHRKYTLEAIIAYREAKLGLVQNDLDPFFHVQQATPVRAEALALVRQQETGYRYPLEKLTTQRWGHTAYHFGYLYTVHDLHFWEREEQQIVRNKWGPLFMNIWAIPRIIGLTN